MRPEVDADLLLGLRMREALPTSSPTNIFLASSLGLPNCIFPIGFSDFPVLVTRLARLIFLGFITLVIFGAKYKLELFHYITFTIILLPPVSFREYNYILVHVSLW